MKQGLRQLTKIFGQHTFSNSTFVFYIMLVFQDSSEHWELLQVSQVTSERTVGINPTGRSLGGLPSILGAPNRKLQNHTETSIPTQSPSSGDLCLSSSEGRNPNMPNTEPAERGHNIFTTSPALDPSTGQGSGGSRQGSGKKSGRSFATITPAPLKAGVWGNVPRPHPYHPYPQGNKATRTPEQGRHLVHGGGGSNPNRVFIFAKLARE